MRLYFHINEEDRPNYSFMRTTIIRNSILLGILMVLVGYANQYDQLTDYFSIFTSHIIFVFMSALICICSINTHQEAKPIPYFQEPTDPQIPQESESETPAAEQATESTPTTSAEQTTETDQNE